MSKTDPVGTVRIVGIVVVAGGRALDLAIVETDGADLVRRIETERVVLEAGALEVTAVAAVRGFLGDRALQPFAVDLLALDAERGELTRAALAAGVGVAVVVSPMPGGDVRFARAERIALGAAGTIQGLPLSHRP
jgi:hypothetical protein